MKPESDNDPLIDALRADLPNEQQSARLRTRLAALGITSAGALATSSAVAAGAAAKTAAHVGLAAGALARFSALSLGAKVGVAGVVCGSLVAAPAVMLTSSNPPAAVTSAPAKSRQAAPRQSGRPIAATPVSRVPAVPPPSVAARSPESDALTPQASPIAEPPTRKNEGVAAPRIASVSAETTPAATPMAEPQAAPVAAFETNEASLPGGSVSAASAPVEPAPRAPAVTTLSEETMLMDRALAALRTGDRQLALRLVMEHERRFPNGLLRREREKARAVLARPHED